MIRVTLRIFVVVFLLLTASIRSQQLTGSIDGIVLQFGSSEPIAGAYVSLMGANQGAPIIARLLARTNSQGRFVFPDLEWANYRIFVSADTYDLRNYDESNSATSFDLTPARPSRTLRFVLKRAGTISGRVRDLNGKPVAGVPVQVLRIIYNPLGEQRLQAVASSVSNDLGEYRAYWVSPGRYVLMAGSAVYGRTSLYAYVPNELKLGLTVPPTFFPSSPTRAFATVVEVNSGGDLNGMDFNVEPRPRRTIRGRIVNPPGPAFPVSVRLISETIAGDIFAPYFVYDAADGTFVLEEVPAGTHQILAEVLEPGQPNIGSTVQFDAVSSARALTNRFAIARGIRSVDVRDSDAENVSISIGKPVSLMGSALIDGTAHPESLLRVRVQLTPLTNGISTPYFSSLTSTAFNVDGSFTITNASPGTYRLQVSGLTPNYYLKEAHSGVQDILNNPLVVTDSGAGSLSLVFSSKGGRIEGTVIDNNSQPMENARAVLVPVNQAHRADLFRVATASATGRFQMDAVEPGTYRVFAGATVEPSLYFDAELLKPLETRGVLVSVTPSTTHSVRVTALPPQP